MSIHVNTCQDMTACRILLNGIVICFDGVSKQNNKRFNV